jgi:hypothetical protein
MSGSTTGGGQAAGGAGADPANPSTRPTAFGGTTEKYYADLFQKVHLSNWLTTVDQNSPHLTAGNEMWETGEWSGTIQGQNFGPIHSKGYVSSIVVREGDIWKKRMQMSNVTRNNKVGLAISFAVPAFAQQKETVDPQIIEQLAALGRKIQEAWNNNDAAAVAATYTEDAVLVTDTGLVYGREAIEKYHADLFKQIHISNQFGKSDEYSPHIIGTAGNELCEQQGMESDLSSQWRWSRSYTTQGLLVKYLCS